MRTASKAILPIQYLRGLAALAVVFHHGRSPEPWLLNPLSNYQLAARGVDLFFVISGFIIFHVGSTESPLEFGVKRVARVAPMYWMATLFYMFASQVTASPGAIFRSMLFIPFYDPLHGNQIWPILVPGWTLNYEMFFYLLFFLGLSLSRPLAFSVITLGLLMLAGWIFAPSGAITRTFTSPQLLEFALGMLLAFANAKTGIKLPGAAGILSITIGISALFLPQISETSPLPTFLIAAAASFLTVLGTIMVNNAYDLPRLYVPKILGDASYSIYLFHIPVRDGITSFVAAKGISSNSGFWMLMGGEMVASIAVGIALHLAIEKPLVSRASMLGLKLLARARA